MSRMKTYLLVGIGAFLSLVGTVLFFSWVTLFQAVLYKQLQVSNESDTFKLWRDTPVPMYMNFYVFNWTNPEEIGIEKPKLKEMGPYYFDLTEKKTNIISNENGTVTFTISRHWFFNKEKSIGTLDDVVTMLNPTALSAAFAARHWSSFMKNPLSIGMYSTNTKLFVRKKIGNILFYGYNDPLISIARSLPSFAGVEMPFDKFGWFYKRNGSSDFEGVFNMDTGENDIFNLGKLHNWNYMPRTDFYEGTCGMVNGSAGELFPPKQDKEKKLKMFSADLCRSIELSFKEEIEVHGIKGYKYAGDEYTFDNGTLDASNACFCDGDCSPSGVLNVTSCRLGAPGFVSFPHFYLGDKYYSDQVEGIAADPVKHSLYIAVEPETGIPLDVAARFQINLLLAPYDFVGILKNVPKIYFPMLWFEQRASITKELAHPLKIVAAAPELGRLFFVSMFLFGILFILIAVSQTYISKDHKKQEKEIELCNLPLTQNGNNVPLLEQKNNQNIEIISPQSKLLS